MSQTEQIPASAPAMPHTLIERHTSIIRRVPLTLLDEPANPMRHSMDEEAMQELMDSIRRSGLLQNLCVIPILNGERVAIPDPSDVKLVAHENSGGRYRVAAGHRRLLACRAIFLDAVQCKVFCDPATSEAEIMAGENTIREQPTDFDLAVMYAEWLQIPGITELEVAKRAGKSITFVYARVALLQGWKEVSEALQARTINYAVAKAINKEEDEAYMKLWLKMAIDQGATAKVVNAWIDEHAAHVALAAPAGPAPIVGVSVTAHAPQVIECLLCGDKQSYNLRTVMLCVSDVDRIKEAREAAQRAERESEPES
jgi:ParB-like chromosome segregation protein Spo0J